MFIFLSSWISRKLWLIIAWEFKMNQICDEEHKMIPEWIANMGIYHLTFYLTFAIKWMVNKWFRIKFNQDINTFPSLFFFTYILLTLIDFIGWVDHDDDDDVYVVISYNHVTEYVNYAPILSLLFVPI